MLLRKVRLRIVRERSQKRGDPCISLVDSTARRGSNDRCDLGDVAQGLPTNYGLTCTVFIGYKQYISLKALFSTDFIITRRGSRREEP